MGRMNHRKRLNWFRYTKWIGAKRKVVRQIMPWDPLAHCAIQKAEHQLQREVVDIQKES
jgi:hypothetical protein